MREEELEKIIKKQVKDYHRRKAKLFLEMSVGEAIEHFGIAETKKILECYLDSLEEFR